MKTKVILFAMTGALIALALLQPWNSPETLLDPKYFEPARRISDNDILRTLQIQGPLHTNSSGSRGGRIFGSNLTVLIAGPSDAIESLTLGAEVSARNTSIDATTLEQAGSMIDLVAGAQAKDWFLQCVAEIRDKSLNRALSRDFESVMITCESHETKSADLPFDIRVHVVFRHKLKEPTALTPDR